MTWISILEKLLAGEIISEVPTRPERTWTREYAIWRYCQAKAQSPDAHVDHAVLLRQCLRWISPRRLRADRVSQIYKERFRQVAITTSLSGYLEVQPYKPKWLEEGPGANELDALPMSACIDESFHAEEWLEKTTGKKLWRSHVQKEGCWEILNAEPGTTHLIGLPTGAGKSLLFQVAAAFSSRLTVVVVPTIALGLDQMASARKLPAAVYLNPQNYSSQDGMESVKDAVANRQCRLLFTSPEACVSGGMRAILDKHAQDGWLEWVVVDEAHIVESWGADFRIEFQLLGALVREWRSRTERQLKTLLLSATFAESTKEMLRGLFVDPGGHWKANVIQRLRPEIHYHFKNASCEEEQVTWVMESLLHLPRPMILYVTEKAEADAYCQRAKEIGLKRVACFHGDTPNWQRSRIMEEWRTDRIDLMVATSAFGMGVDKPDVRCVLHACFPESIDRFYQEVGRGGRDGASTQSVMIYTKRDQKVGKGLTPTLLKSETITDRWAALWASRRGVNGETECFQLRTDARRDDFVGRRTYQENIRWNKRLLQMLHRGRLLSITGLVSEKADADSDEYLEWVSIKDLRFPPLDPTMGERLSDQRTNELAVFAEGYQALERCTAGAAVCCELQTYYGGHVSRACGSCNACRNGREERRVCGQLIWPEDSPQTTPRVQVVPMSRPHTQKGKAQWILALRKILNDGVGDRFVTTEKNFDTANSLLLEAVGTANLLKYRLDAPDNQSVFGTSERIIALHLFDFCPELDVLNVFGKSCSHWIPDGHVEDHHGRSRFTQEHGARLFDTFETWFFETRRKST